MNTMFVMYPIQTWWMIWIVLLCSLWRVLWLLRSSWEIALDYIGHHKSKIEVVCTKMVIVPPNHLRVEMCCHRWSWHGLILKGYCLETSLFLCFFIFLSCHVMKLFERFINLSSKMGSPKHVLRCLWMASTPSNFVSTLFCSTSSSKAFPLSCLWVPTSIWWITLVHSCSLELLAQLVMLTTLSLSFSGVWSWSLMI